MAAEKSLRGSIDVVAGGVVKGSRGHRLVLRALELIDYKKALTGWKRVFIKVNFISTRTWKAETTTDPIVVEAIINGFSELPVEVYVIKSDAIAIDRGADGHRRLRRHGGPRSCPRQPRTDGHHPSRD